MDTNLDKVIKDLPSVPKEGGITGDYGYNFVVESDLTSDESFTLTQTLASFLEEQLLGMGHVSLVSMEVRFMTTAANQTVVFGFGNANATLTEIQIGMGLFGDSHTSNTFNFGSRQTWSFPVPAMFSAQIQPASSNLPPLKFYLKASGRVKVNLIMKMKFDGIYHVRRLYDTESHNVAAASSSSKKSGKA